MNHANEKRKMRMVRHRRVRARVFGVADKPRLCVFRSNKHLSAQIIDDVSGKVLASAWTKEIAQGTASFAKSGAKKTGKTAKSGGASAANNTASAETLGALIAKKATEKKIKHVVFDRGGYAYHGKIKAFAEGARKGGLQF